jgi:hypothetical protein
MKNKKPKRPRRRLRVARPLLVAAGAALLIGCTDNSCNNGICAMDQGVIVDMGIPAGDQ